VSRYRVQTEYPGPPSRWPFPPLGRNFFLLSGALLLTITLFPFWGSIAVAAVFSLGLSGIMGRASHLLGGRRRLTAGLLVAALTVLVMLPALMFSLRLYNFFADQRNHEISRLLSGDTLERFGAAFERIEDLMVGYGVGSRLFDTGMDVRDAIRQGASGLVSQLMALLSSAVVSLPEVFLSLLVFALFLYVFLSYPVPINRLLLRLNAFQRIDLKRSIRILRASSYNSLVANFLVGVLQASIITGGAAAIGFGDSILIFSVVFVLSYIPFIGSAPVGYLIAVLAFLGDGWAPAAVMAGVATFAGLIDNVVRPYLVAKGGVEVHPVLSFASILGAIGVFGLKGIFLGPVILTATIALLGRTTAQPQRARQLRPPPEKAA
jgi:predicted PurR-regulated permease PerM